MSKTIIIAEAGVNHNGDIDMAKKLIDVAAISGADYVKFQTFKADKLVSPQAKKADYQLTNGTDKYESQYDMLKRLELSHNDISELIKYCNSKDIKFFSTAFDVEGVSYLKSLNLNMFKIPSGEITNYPYLREVGCSGLPVIISTGMSNMKEVEAAIEVLIFYGVKKSELYVLHCNTEYPTPLEDVNLYAMNSIGKRFGVKVGYSDHTLGIEVPIAAVALGAKVIEKHFTLDRNLTGPDHSSSLEPKELIQMVKSIRNTEKAISGDAKKNVSKSELKNRNIARKSIHLKKSMSVGTKIKENDIISLRPGDGISPMEWKSIIGKEIKTDLKKLTKLSWDHLL